MFLSDRDIRRIGDAIRPFDVSRVRPASYEVRLGHDFRFIMKGDDSPLDPKSLGEHTVKFVRFEDDPLELRPQEFVLGATIESVKIPPHIACEVRGKSTLGRLGLQVHTTAGWIDPGFSGVITLELFNCGPRSLLLWPGMDIAQLTFMRLTSTCQKPYGHPDHKSKYQHSSGVVAAK